MALHNNPRFYDAILLKEALRQNLWVNWGSAPDPGVLGGMGSGVRGAGEKGPAGRDGERGLRLRRTIGRVIPCLVASPQSRTPFHPAA